MAVNREGGDLHVQLLEVIRRVEGDAAQLAAERLYVCAAEKQEVV